MNTNSNTYTIGYASLVVIIVAFLLAFLSKVLEPQSQANERIDKKKQILAALNIRGINNTEVENEYAKYVTADKIITIDGTVKNPGKNKDQAGFLIQTKDISDNNLPLYICSVDGETKYVIPLSGKGLWGAIWGYIALNADKNTIFGAYFSHQSETAGLGARITEENFQNEFQEKKIHEPGSSDIKLRVAKYGKVADERYECDGISGATLTMNGLTVMFRDCIAKYMTFLTSID